MRIVDYDNGVLELRWMWLPTFIGQSRHVLKELETAWRAKFTGHSGGEEGLNEIHEWTLDWLCERFQIEGLREYLAGLKNVNMENDHVSAHEATGG